MIRKWQQGAWSA